METDVEGARILVDTPHQILVNKLCALLSRSELRESKTWRRYSASASTSIARSRTLQCRMGDSRL